MSISVMPDGITIFINADEESSVSLESVVSKDIIEAVDAYIKLLKEQDETASLPEWVMIRLKWGNRK